MTDNPNLITAEHLEVVARLLSTYWVGGGKTIATPAWHHRAMADLLLTDPPADVRAAFAAALGLTEEEDVEWCSEANPYWRCDAPTYDSPYTCGDTCRLPGPHEQHECVNGHTRPFDEDDEQPKRSRRYVSPWRQAGDE